MRRNAMRQKIVTTGEGPLNDEGPLISVSGDGLPCFTRGPHQGKKLSEIKKAELTVLLRRRYAHPSDPELLLNEHLSRQYGRPMTAKTALAAMQEDWAEMQRKLNEIRQQPSLSEKLMNNLSERLSEAAHEADTWPDAPPDVG